MEFDVIFLSVVRSNGKPPKFRRGKEEQEIDFHRLGLDDKEEDDVRKEKDQRDEYRQQVGLQNYGFLISENRLCVSLSRQKRLLIVVGNSDIFTEEKWGLLADACVPGMKKLYELCEEKGVVYDGSTQSV
jgi:superfamily I DNA and/or RNA helicase